MHAAIGFRRRRVSHIWQAADDAGGRRTHWSAVTRLRLKPQRCQTCPERASAIFSSSHMRGPRPAAAAKNSATAVRIVLLSKIAAVARLSGRSRHFARRRRALITLSGSFVGFPRPARSGGDLYDLITFNDEAEADARALESYAAFRREARTAGARRFLEVHNANAPGAVTRKRPAPLSPIASSACWPASPRASGPSS